MSVSAENPDNSQPCMSQPQLHPQAQEQQTVPESPNVLVETPEEPVPATKVTTVGATTHDENNSDGNGTGAEKNAKDSSNGKGSDRGKGKGKKSKSINDKQIEVIPMVALDQSTEDNVVADHDNEHENETTAPETKEDTAEQDKEESEVKQSEIQN